MRRLVLAAALAVAALATPACGGPDPALGGRTELSDKWFKRAQASYAQGDLDDARAALDSALAATPKDPDTRLLGAKIALARLEFDEAARHASGLPSSEAHALRGRALWYAGDLEQAADELEAAQRDPTFKDSWVREVAKLARRGHGRHPYTVEGGMLAAVEMPPAGPAMVVPCELEGERILALVATGMGEVMIDASSRKEPAWVNLKFGDSLEVKDVPALTYDLAPLSRQFGAPIKALLGVGFLRKVHATFDRRGSQFVIRKAEATPPPEAATLPVVYVRGGGMVVRADVAPKADGRALFFVDSAALYPAALDDATFKRAGADLTKFHPEPGAPPSWKTGPLPVLRVAGLDLPDVPSVQGIPLAEYRQNLGYSVDGILGSGLLMAFRVTFAEGGRSLWMEPDPQMTQSPAAAGVTPASDLPPPGAPPAPPAPPAREPAAPAGAPKKPEAQPKPAAPGPTAPARPAAPKAVAP